MFAIVKIAGKQYKVEKDAVIEVDRIDGNEGETVTFTDVLLRQNEAGIDVGTPNVPQSKVTGTILKQFRGDKIEVLRYKHKVRYRKHIGFRPNLTSIKITQIA